MRPGLLLISVLAMAGCSQTGNIDQSNICVVAGDEEAKQCKNGEPFFFGPPQWGNDQLPLRVAAVYCDTNHPISFNNGGVICTFTGKRLHLLDPKDETPKG